MPIQDTFPGPAQVNTVSAKRVEENILNAHLEHLDMQLNYTKQHVSALEIIANRLFGHGPESLVEDKGPAAPVSGDLERLATQIDELRRTNNRIQDLVTFINRV